MPALEGRRHIRKYFTMEFAVLVSCEPNFSLNIFQGGGFPVLIHEPVNVGDGIRGPIRRTVSLPNIAFVLVSERAQVCISHVGGHTAASEWEQNVIHKSNRSGCSFDVEQNARHQATEVRPKQMASNFSSTPLSV